MTGTYGVCAVSAIQANSAVPMYRQAANYFRQRIQRGELTEGDRIPSEVQLCELLGISRITVRQALSELEGDGLLERIPGKGTYVQRRPTRLERLTGLTGFGENATARGLKPSYQVLSVDVAPARFDVAQALTVSDDVLVVSRILLAGGQPVAVHTSYLPLWVVAQAAPGRFTEESLSTSSLYQAIIEAGIDLVRADEIVEPGVATPEQAAHLRMSEAGLVLRVIRTTYSSDARPIEYVILTYRADLYSYRVTLYANRQLRKQT